MQFLKLISITVLVVLLASECLAFLTLYQCKGHSIHAFRYFGSRNKDDILLHKQTDHAGAGVTSYNWRSVNWPVNAQDKGKYTITYMFMDDKFGELHSCTIIKEGSGVGHSHVNMTHNAYHVYYQFKVVTRIYGKANW